MEPVLEQAERFHGVMAQAVETRLAPASQLRMLQQGLQWAGRLSMGLRQERLGARTVFQHRFGKALYAELDLWDVLYRG
ncbi:MAG: hypothetical protein GWN58_07225, partial [Anaerolineae bacterium]|nr:hypothetical protein [Anaerolineae bacterium]